MDKSLDEIISESSKNKRTGPIRNSNNRNKNFKNSYNNRNTNFANSVQQQQMLQNQMLIMQSNALQGAHTLGKIRISNLDYNVTEKDLKDLFGQIGPLVSATLNHDANGKSKGNGTVVFSNPYHAAFAIQKYNGVTLDGRPMRIELLSSYESHPQMAMLSMQPQVRGPNTFGSNTMQMNYNFQGNRARHNPYMKNPGGFKNKHQNSANRPVTSEELDSEMEKYMHSEQAEKADAPK
ncbi:THO complex subunit 4A [Zancudomyces culisetae]|uniref:THO complex subunit 4A n=1 Tax=Zancudomyces culisetae TaxID=1213189 RepID=A0A1R1PW62_ZANCU|nr:THO complex subunit 4A [Zancudomyces culisetae]|eukprot:OMH85201.1 THO complex subunit 4A [Zancudomyces culisetae]